jgi:dihydroflavonol-4-reductase
VSCLVTGANGFVGSHLTRALLQLGDQVRILVRPQSDLRAVQGLPVEIVYGDLRDPGSLEAAVRGMRRVFHAAADYRLWASHPQEIYDSNVGGTQNILQAALRAGVERFIYTSSVATLAVDRPTGLPSEQTEARLEEMIGHYKRSKFLAEQEAFRAAREGLPVIIVNPSTPVGPGDWKPTPTGRIILDFLNGRMPAYIQTGLNLVPVEDVAIGHCLAAERGRPGERYILGARNLLLKEILDILAGITGLPSPRLRLPHAVALAAGHADQLLARVLNRPPRIPLEGVRMAGHLMFVDASRAQRELGFEPGSVESALERAVTWFQENRYVRGSRLRETKLGVAA